MADPNGFAMNSGELKATARYFDQIQRASDRLGRTRYQNIIKLNNELKFTARHFDQIYRTALKLSRLKLMPRVTLDDKASGDIDRLLVKLAKVKSQVIRASADVNLRVNENRTSSASGITPQKVDLTSISAAINSLAVKLNTFGPTTNSMATASATASVAIPVTSPAASSAPAVEEEPKTVLTSLIEGLRGGQQMAGGAKGMLAPFIGEEKKEGEKAEEKPADRVEQTEQRVQQTQPSSSTLTQPSAGGLLDANGRPIISTPTPPPSPGPIVDETGTPVISDQQRAANEKAEKKQARKTKWQNRFKSAHGFAEKSEGFLGGFADILEGGSASVGGMQDAWNAGIDGLFNRKKNAEEPSTSPAAESSASQAESTPADSAGADAPDGGKAKGGFFKRLLKGGLKKLPGVAGLGVDIANIFQASEGKERYQAIGSTIGNLAGGALGGLVGSIIPVGGTAIGGMAGGAGGEWLGNKIGGWFYDKFGGKEEPKPAEVTAPPAAAIQESAVTATAQATSSMAVSEAQTQAIAQTAAQAAVQAQATVATPPSGAAPVEAGIQLSEGQLSALSGMIQDAKAEVTNQISINISPGTVQLDIHEEIDYAEIEGKIGASIVAKVRQAFQNYKPSGGGGGSAGPAQSMAT